MRRSPLLRAFLFFGCRGHGAAGGPDEPRTIRRATRGARSTLRPAKRASSWSAAANPGVSHGKPQRGQRRPRITTPLDVSEACNRNVARDRRPNVLAALDDRHRGQIVRADNRRWRQRLADQVARHLGRDFEGGHRRRHFDHRDSGERTDSLLQSRVASHPQRRFGRWAAEYSETPVAKAVEVSSRGHRGARDIHPYAFGVRCKVICGNLDARDLPVRRQRPHIGRVSPDRYNPLDAERQKFARLLRGVRRTGDRYGKQIAGRSQARLERGKDAIVQAIRQARNHDADDPQRSEASARPAPFLTYPSSATAWATRSRALRASPSPAR